MAVRVGVAGQRRELFDGYRVSVLQDESPGDLLYSSVHIVGPTVPYT